MLKIGLTGGIGCGKSTVSTLFSSFGIAIIDADDISRDLVQPNNLRLKKYNNCLVKTSLPKTAL